MRLVGRERESAELARLLGVGERFVSVSGRAGVGKSALLTSFSDWRTPGIRRFDADLAGSADGSPLLDAVARRLGMGRPGAVAADGIAAVAAAIGDRSALIVVDHADACVVDPSSIDALLSACPRLAVVLAARAPAHHGVELELLPIAVPAPDADGEQIRANASVRLFAERAMRTSAQFRLDDATAESVAEVCRLLGGLPLAIELAAARMTVFTPEQLLRRLRGDGHGLDLLAGHHGATSRVSIREALSSTLSGLTPGEREVLSVLAGFEGPVPFSAALDLSGRPAGDALDALQRLVDVRLVEPVHVGAPPEAVFDLLPIVRSFVRERQPEAHAHTELRRAAISVWLFEAAGALEAARASESVGIARVLRRDLVEEARRLVDDDAESGAAWLMACAPVLAGLPEIVEVTELIEQVIASGLVDDFPPPLAARVWMWSSHLLALSPDGAGLRELVIERRERATALVATVEDPYLDLQLRLVTLVNFISTGDLGPAVEAAMAGARTARERAEPAWSARFEVWLASAAHASGDIPKALELALGALDRAQRVQDPVAIVSATVILHTLPPGTVPPGTPVPPLETARDLARSRGESTLERYALAALTSEERAGGRPRKAAKWLAEQLTQDDPAGWLVEAQVALVQAALISEDLGDDRFTARMLGVVRADLDRTLRAMAARTRPAVDQTFAGLDERLGPALAAELIGAGGALSIPDAAQEAAVWLAAHSGEPERPAPDPLTPREAEVLAVLAEGLSNKEIAAELGLSVKTVMHHSVAIYRKLDVRGRAEATAVAHRQGLVPGAAQN